MSNEHNVATAISQQMADMIISDQIPPAEVILGAMRGSVAFWMGCVKEGSRIEALGVLRQVLNEEIDHMTRGIANGMVPE